MKSLSNKERYKEIGVSMAIGPSTIIKEDVHTLEHMRKPPERKVLPQVG